MERTYISPKGKLRVARRVYCRVCTSPYRPEIEKLIRMGVALNRIAVKYHEVFEISFDNLKMKLYRHVKNKHPKIYIDMTPLKKEDMEKDFPVTQEGLANQWLKYGFQIPQDEIKPHHVIGAQKMIIEKQKMQVQTDALKFAMIKFMRGIPQPIEGELIGDNRPELESKNPDGQDTVQ